MCIRDSSLIQHFQWPCCRRVLHQLWLMYHLKPFSNKENLALIFYYLPMEEFIRQQECNIAYSFSQAKFLLFKRIGNSISMSYGGDAHIDSWIIRQHFQYTWGPRANLGGTWSDADQIQLCVLLLFSLIQDLPSSDNYLTLPHARAIVHRFHHYRGHKTFQCNPMLISCVLYSNSLMVY